jgi:hypothetical protein
MHRRPEPVQSHNKNPNRIRPDPGLWHLGLKVHLLWFVIIKGKVTDVFFAVTLPFAREMSGRMLIPQLSEHPSSIKSHVEDCKQFFIN